MRIGGPIPINIARAYGVNPSQRSAPIAPTAAPTPAAPAQRDTAEPSPRIEQLFAGKVSGPVDFAAASTPTSPAGPFQLYNRAADKIEATVAVAIGRAIDIKG